VAIPTENPVGMIKKPYQGYCRGSGSAIGNSLYGYPTFPVEALVEARVRQPTELPNSLVDK